MLTSHSTNLLYQRWCVSDGSDGILISLHQGTLNVCLTHRRWIENMHRKTVKGIEICKAFTEYLKAYYSKCYLVNRLLLGLCKVSVTVWPPCTQRGLQQQQQHRWIRPGLTDNDSSAKGSLLKQHEAPQQPSSTATWRAETKLVRGDAYEQK